MLGSHSVLELIAILGIAAGLLAATGIAVYLSDRMVRNAANKRDRDGTKSDRRR